MKRFLFSFFLLLTAAVGRAHDFKVDGIYYNITSTEELTVEVTYRGDWFYSYKDEYSGDVIIPEGVSYDGVVYNVTAIGEGAFYDCSSLTSVTIPNSVKAIGDDAFDSCKSLTSVTIPNSVTEIGKGAFDCCSGLTSITIPYGVTSIDKYTFRWCSGLTSVTIPNSVTEIGEGAFYSCEGLTSVTIPHSVTKIGDNAFIYCSNLTSLTIGNSVITIGEGAFTNCRSLTSLAIPNSVTTIGERAFTNCSSLTSLNIPNSVTTIGNKAFFGCSSLESIVVTNGNPIYDSRDNCNAIIETSSNTLISGCNNTVIPNNVEVIGEGACFECSGLTSITIPNSVTTIANSAFTLCSSLTSLIIPNSVTTIGKAAFSGCSSLESVVVTNGNPIYDSRDNCNAIIETSSNTLISGCNNTVIPNSVTEIGEWAFYECSALKDVYCLAESVPNTSYNVFYDVKLSSAVLHVPATSLEAYSTTRPWSSFGQIVAIDGGDGIEKLTSEESASPTVYDFSGRRVSKPRKGLYVIGGRKTVVK